MNTQKRYGFKIAVTQNYMNIMNCSHDLSSALRLTIEKKVSKIPDSAPINMIVSYKDFEKVYNLKNKQCICSDFIRECAELLYNQHTTHILPV